MSTLQVTEKEQPIAYLAWRDGEPCWDEDCVCQDPVYPVDTDDDRTSMPVYTRPSNLIAQRNALEQALEVLYLKNNAGLPTYDSMVNQTIIAIRKVLYKTQD